MDCDWESVLEACPRWIRQPVDELGKKDLRELRLRLGRGPLLVFDGRTWEIPGSIAPEDLQFSVNAASQYSPWAAESMAKGLPDPPRRPPDGTVWGDGCEKRLCCGISHRNLPVPPGGPGCEAGRGPELRRLGFHPDFGSAGLGQDHAFAQSCQEAFRKAPGGGGGRASGAFSGRDFPGAGGWMYSRAAARPLAWIWF